MLKPLIDSSLARTTLYRGQGSRFTCSTGNGFHAGAGLHTSDDEVVDVALSQTKLKVYIFEGAGSVKEAEISHHTHHCRRTSNSYA